MRIMLLFVVVVVIVVVHLIVVKFLYYNHSYVLYTYSFHTPNSFYLTLIRVKVRSCCNVLKL